MVDRTGGEEPSNILNRAALSLLCSLAAPANPWYRALDAETPVPLAWFNVFSFMMVNLWRAHLTASTIYTVGGGTEKRLYLYLMTHLALVALTLTAVAINRYFFSTDKVLSAEFH